MLEGTSGLCSDEEFTASPTQPGNVSAAVMVQKREPHICCLVMKFSAENIRSSDQGQR